eukprot:GHVL01043583.1.p1 GENE.GHVL01043583.1~~GHVL01043583.1.p1  ORF type:complete len:122 (+),score=22.08 GHVL01043583.1:282-647(+)
MYITQLPGGVTGAERLRDCEMLIKMLKTQKQEKRIYSAICAAPALVLAHHGLIDDVPACCYPLPVFSDKLKKYVPTVRVQVSDNCVTSIGPGSSIEFALALTKLLVDEEKSNALKDGMRVN